MAYKLIFAFHATQRMLQRNISVDDVKFVVEHGEVIETYPDYCLRTEHPIMGC